ncbi:hypothetical protein GDI2726 [Gluconacetobacter diazotrophicus PA1 5]|uniref:Uncharacterized protein n=1 Tax=Gluconacetobacter diazotrophicus (strain ATCC 49037 / DSM 5601 / CCUG 37298 / CIP 103539 / LMG 7603 / PAl5) TaxID=272568 RepID=A9HQ29_GLUDA|nr:hypothetical protein GDI2726 [Gluconacetobacter diazotrophicus PA1 5]
MGVACWYREASSASRKEFAKTAVKPRFVLKWRLLQLEKQSCPRNHTKYKNPAKPIGWRGFCLAAWRDENKYQPKSMT